MSEIVSAEQPVVPTPRLGVQAVLRTDVGLVRSENQDFGTYTTPREESHSHPGGRLLVVADGMGGHRGGATASRLAGETVKAQYLGSETYDISQALREALARANARIFSESQANPDLRGMGTTTSALVVKNNQAWFAHVGDSRIYVVRGDDIRQITEDHSLVASMVREGLLTAKEAETHPRRNVLQRSMGVSEDVEIDVSGPFDVLKDDVFILCSDGLHGLVKEPELKEIAALPIDQAATEYVKRALARGAPDNVTVIVAKIVPADDAGETTLVDADETLADHPYDETQRDTAPIGPLIEQVQAEEAAQAAASPEPVTAPGDVPIEHAGTLETAVETDAATAKTIETPIDSAPAPRRSLFGWLLIAVLALGAAGAWVYWNQQHQGAASKTTAPSRR
ncbi:MAG TPA: Stp1/IreP family PP2C-type Ser/Thr phosphatase [Thermoanaerobaculia bacterium]|jgi:protein phosphatase|nr:Stp1/IreP family PP2C-type Ser/Thr phosphatase [Thermoanaerobaculia bacterium]